MDCKKMTTGKPTLFTFGRLFINRFRSSFLGAVFLAMSSGLSLEAATFDSNSAVIDNKYHPLNVGAKFTRVGTGLNQGRSNTQVATAIETIDGIKCIRVDYTTTSSTPIVVPYTGSTWYAQDTSGAVWCIEPGDEDEDYLEMPANPQVGVMYDIWILTEEVLSLTAQASVPAGTYSGCLQWRNYDAHWPDNIQRQEYYAPWVGLIKMFDAKAGWELKSVSGLTPQPELATITVFANPVAGGTVICGGSFPIGSRRQISAAPALCFIFTGWDDGNTDNPRTITVPAGGSSYTANFTNILVNAVHPFVDANGFTMRATFIPQGNDAQGNVVTLEQAAAICGVDHFNWIQYIKHVPTHWRVTSGLLGFGSVVNPPFLDPIASKLSIYKVTSVNFPGNYCLLNPWPGNEEFDDAPFYWNEPNERLKHTRDRTLYFNDSAGFASWMVSAANKDYVMFETRLAGVYADGSFKTWGGVGANFQWKSDAIINGIGGVIDFGPFKVADPANKPTLITGGVYETVADVPYVITAIANSSSQGSVTGTGTYVGGSNAVLTAIAKNGYSFMNWTENGTVVSTSASYTFMVNGKRSLVANFLNLNTVGVGVVSEIPFPDVFAGAAKTTVKGLPAGLKYNASTKLIAGVPTKAGTYNVVFSATDVGSQTVTVTVAALPASAQGTFNGYVEGGGLATMTVSALGKVTGKLVFGGTNYTFSAPSYGAGSDPANGFSVTTVAKAGKVSIPLTLLVTQASDPQALGVAAGTLGNLPVALYRDVWKTEAGALAPFIGYYTAALPGNAEYGSGYLTFTVDNAGKVKIGGKLADGTAVSQSGTLVMDENERLYAVVYTAPKTYNGGGLFGFAEFADTDEVCLRPLDGAPFLWTSRNPQATQTYGDGFNRAPGLTGGWYSKTENLSAYYAGMSLTVGADTNAPMPELTVGAVRYDSVCWNPTGVVLTPVLKSGVLSGLSAPTVGKPTDADKDGTWDYSTVNSVGLKIALTRATGIFKGSFLAWFDYPEKKHVSKSLAFEGALTPVRENMDDGVAGRGFFLWADKSLSPAYAFKWSYDFKILLSDPVQ